VYTFCENCDKYLCSDCDFLTHCISPELQAAQNQQSSKPLFTEGIDMAPITEISHDFEELSFDAGSRYI
jgi:hypothetical protein